MLSQLLDSAPERIEVRDGLVHFFHGGNVIFTQPVHAALKTSHMVQAAIRDWYERSCDNVVLLGLPSEH